MSIITRLMVGVVATVCAPMLAIAQNTIAERTTDWTRNGADATPAHKARATDGKAKGRYAVVNGLRMYYEVHGNGRPLVLLHGGLATIDTSFGKILPFLAKTRQVIAIELQGHGHTADIDRPMSFEQMADDVDSLLGQLAIERADLLGYSFGGMVVLGTAIRHPERVNHLIVVGTPNSGEGFEPTIREAIKNAAPEDVPKPLKDAYERSAPNPQQFPALVAKVAKLLTEFPGWRDEELRSIGELVMLIVGDHDFIRPEHAVQMFRLIPNAQLAVLPGAGHDAITERYEDVLAAMTRFLDAVPSSQSKAGQ